MKHPLDDDAYQEREESRWREPKKPWSYDKPYACICGSFPGSICFHGNKRGCSSYGSNGRVAPTKTWAVLRQKWLALNPGKLGPNELSDKLLGYKAEFSISKKLTAKFKTHDGALKYLEGLEEKFRAANFLCDNDIWTSIELIYECRWDCPTTRLAAAI